MLPVRIAVYTRCQESLHRHQIWSGQIANHNFDPTANSVPYPTADVIQPMKLANFCVVLLRFHTVKTFSDQYSDR